MRHWRKTILISFVILLFLGFIGFYSYYKFGLFTPFSPLQAKHDIKNGLVQIIKYGELGPNEKLEIVVAEKYGFRFKRATYCNVNQIMINGIDCYNSVVKNHLAKIHGEDWKSKFNEQLDKALKQDRFTIIQKGIEIGDASVEILTLLIDDLQKDTLQLSKSKRHDLPYPNYFFSQDFTYLIYETSDYGQQSVITFFDLYKKTKIREINGIISVDKEYTDNYWDATHEILFFYDFGNPSKRIFPSLYKHDFKDNKTDKIYGFRQFYEFEIPTIKTNIKNRTLTIDNKEIKY